MNMNKIGLLLALVLVSLVSSLFILRAREVKVEEGNLLTKNGTQSDKPEMGR